MTLIYILVSTLIISTGALVGIFTLSIKEALLQKALLAFVGFSSGALLGGAFLHLMPEGIENLSPQTFFLLVLGAIVLYLLIEKTLHWHHCHEQQCNDHSIGYMNLVGDGVHNFIDGLIIAASFMISIPLGITTATAIALHEIPQEIGDFGVLLYSGFSKGKALIYNFIVALMVVAGGMAGWVLSSFVDHITTYLIPIAAGGFIYIAVSDLIPELRKKSSYSAFVVNFLLLLAGIALMFLIKFIGE
jgi:zinc and cadmium transporter